MTASYTYQGPTHPFYKQGQTYTLHISRYPIFSRVYIWVEHGYQNKIWAPSKARYRNWEAFNKDWRAK